MVRAFMAEVEASGITDYTAHGLSRPPIIGGVGDCRGL